MANAVLSLDDEETWPPAVRQVLDGSLARLLDYEGEHARIDQLMEEDIVIRCNQPPNPHAADRDRILANIRAAICDGAFVGYHCTRLRAEEIESVRRDGLSPLSVELVCEKVRRCVASGEIVAAVAERVINHNQAHDRSGRRLGLVAFIFTKDLFSQYELFLRRWGGEALRMLHHTDADICRALSMVGTPCIIQAAIPVSRFPGYGYSCEVRILQAFLSRREEPFLGEQPQGLGDWAHIAGAILPDQIQRIIERSDPDFERLTGCSAWSTPLT